MSFESDDLQVGGSISAGNIITWGASIIGLAFAVQLPISVDGAESLPAGLLVIFLIAWGGLATPQAIISWLNDELDKLERLQRIEEIEAGEKALAQQMQLQSHQAKLEVHGQVARIQAETAAMNAAIVRNGGTPGAAPALMPGVTQTQAQAFNPATATQPEQDATTSGESDDLLQAAEAQSQSVLKTGPDTRTALQILTENAALSLGLYGGQRVGKSYLAAVASRIRAMTRGTKVFLINLNSFDEEDGYYWAHCHKQLVVNVHKMDSNEAIAIVKDAIALVKEFQDTTNAMLIIDEWSSTGSKVMTHQEALEDFATTVAGVNNAISPTAIKRKQCLWLLTPDIVASEFTQAAKSIKKLPPVICAVHPSYEVKYMGDKLDFDDQLLSQVNKNYPGTEIGKPSGVDAARVVYINGQWRATGLRGDELDAAKADYENERSAA